MRKFTVHILSNWKVYIRFLATFLFVLFLFSKLWGVYDLIAFSIMFSMLVFDLLKRNYLTNQLEALSYYIFWIIVFLSIIIDIHLRYNYFKTFQYHEFPFFHFPIKEVFIIKLIIVIASFTKHKSIMVPNTILSKIWLVIIFLHFTVLLLNSTYGFEILFLNVAILSAIETLLIIFTEKKLLLYKSSILDFLWKKK